MAKKIVKWVGGLMGWAFGGPIGAIVGYGLGYLWENATLDPSVQTLDDDQSGGNATREGDFNISLLVLSAAVMKADQRILKSELAYVKAFLLSNYSESKAQELLKILKTILDREIDIRQVCIQIRHHMNHAQRLQLVHFLIGIAKADGEVDPREVQILKTIAAYLNVSVQDFSSMNAMYNSAPSKASYYKVLELEEGAGEADVKAAYRKLVKKYHPDRLGDVGEDVKQAALEKFRKVQEAYEYLSKN